MEVLDMDLIRQQAANNAVDIQGLASYIINTMGKFCAPVRDDDIKKLKEGSGDIVKLLKYVGFCLSFNTLLMRSIIIL